VKQGRLSRRGTDDIFVTDAVDGMPQRMIRMWLRAFEAGLTMKKQTGASWGELIRSARAMQTHGAMPLRQAMMAATMPTLIRKAVVDGDIANGVMATGVVGGRIDRLPSCQELVDDIMDEARRRIAALGGNA
jgi:NAD(P)H-dependent flavin oxidoreductase YrpB (nitropropane dioxygenase family)